MNSFADIPQFHDTPDQYVDLMREHIRSYDELQQQLAAATAGLNVTRFLDLGVGSGETSAAVLAVHPDAQAVGVDMGADMLALAGARLGDSADLHLARLEDPLPDGPFDLVVSAFAVHHLDAVQKADLFRRVREVLAPGGLFLLADVVLTAGVVENPTPLNPIMDRPDGKEDQLLWMRAVGFAPTLLWEEGDLALLCGERTEQPFEDQDSELAQKIAVLHAWAQDEERTRAVEGSAQRAADAGVI